MEDLIARNAIRNLKQAVLQPFTAKERQLFRT